jgi:hypothetical protein
MRRFLFALAIALIAVPVWAQQVRIAFHDGQVSLNTVGASPRVILAEWSKIGGTNIINAERVTGAPLTLQLVNVPEAEALEIILRSVAGYMAAPRGQTPGASRYDRILVLPTRTIQASASASAAPARPPGSPPAPTQRFIPPRPSPQPVEEPPDPVEVEDRQDAAQTDPVFTFPQQPNGYRTVPVLWRRRRAGAGNDSGAASAGTTAGTTASQPRPSDASTRTVALNVRRTMT